MTDNKEAIQNPIITVADTERWPLLEMPSQHCSIPISPADEEAITLMDALLNTLDDQAAGLAAIQIGYPRRIFLLRNGKNADGEATNNAYINPVIKYKSRELKNDYEACLSLPHMTGRIRRPKSISIEYMDINGEFHTEVFNGFWARAVCHEMSHLEGGLIIHEIEKTIARQPKKSKWGMILDDAAKIRIQKRRTKNKAACKIRKQPRVVFVLPLIVLFYSELY